MAADPLLSPEIFVADKRGLAEKLRSEFETEGRRNLQLRGRFTVALSGGSLATEFFPSLANQPFDRLRTEFLWADERAVPPTDPQSNYRLAFALWLGPANVPEANIHRMPAEVADLQHAADEYAEELSSVAGIVPCLDLILLGAGEDGHVASLFPGHPVSHEWHRYVAAVEGAPKPPPRRLTLTLPVLINARRVTVVALGKGKAEAIRDAVERDAPTPLGRLVSSSTNIGFLLDQDAASLLWNRVE